MDNKLQLGKTDIYLPPYSVGTSTFGKMYGDITQENINIIVRKSIQNGLNYFDTSPYYGKKLSEINLGKALSGIERDKFIISTKVGRYDDDIFDFSETTIMRSINESLERLQLDYVDILYAHDVEFGDIDMIINETLPALQKIKDAGLTRYIGFSCYPIKLIQTLIERTDINIDVVLSYGHYCLINDTLVDIIPFLNQNNIGLVNASPLCMGLLTNSSPPDWHPSTSEMIDAIDYVTHQLQTKYKIKIEDLALNFPLRNEYITTTLVGIRTLNDLNSLLDTLKNKTLYDDDIYEIVHNLLGKFNNYELS